MGFWAAPGIPKGLRGVNLVLAFIVSVSFVGAMNLLAATTPAYAEAVRNAHPVVALPVAAGLVLLTAWGLYSLIARVIVTAQRIELARASGVEDGDGVLDDVEALLSEMKSGDDKVLRQTAEDLTIESDNLTHEFQRRYFPAKVSRLYSRLIVLGGVFATAVLFLYAGALRRLLFGQGPETTALVAPLTALLLLPVWLMMALLLSAVAHRRSRYKEWRVPRRSLLTIRSSLSAMLEDSVRQMDRVLTSLESWQGPFEPKKVAKKRRQLQVQWQDAIHDKLLYTVLPIRGELIDLPRPIQEVYDRSGSDLHHGIRSLAKADPLATSTPPQRVGDTSIRETVQDLRNARERLVRMRELLRIYNAIVRPYVLPE
jgi:hypothetical protein